MTALLGALAWTPPPAAAQTPGLAGASADTAVSQQVAALIRRGERRRLEGRIGDALDDLTRAHAMAPSPAERAFAAAALGVALREAGRFDAAQARLAEALQNAGPMAGVAALARATLAQLSIETAPVETTAARLARETQALAQMERARAEAAIAEAPLVIAVVTAAQARLAGALGRNDAALEAVADGLAALETGGAVRDAAARHAALALGDAAADLPAEAAQALADRAYALAAGADRIGALAALGQGRAALRRGDPLRAGEAAATALRQASTAADDDVAFRAEWLAARAAAAAGDAAAARAAYRAAFDGLRRFRLRAPMGAPPVTTLLDVRPGGRESRRFQVDYLDFLLRDATDDQDVLTEARRLIEDVKLDEIDEYFDERCVPAREAGADAASLADDVAVLYPLALEDRLELIYAIGGRLGRHTAPIGREALSDAVALLRLRIDAPRASTLTQARALYDLLIAPLEPALLAAGATTLVVAPDGPLRALPFAALWDGERWLAERYATATILGLELVQQRSFTPDAAQVLAAGASDPSPDYPPLPAVGEEIAAVVDAFGGRVLLDEDFRVARVADEIARRGYALVHIATHAEFGAAPEDNFILAQDGRLDVGRLESILRARAVRDDQPVDLLTLSACNTAAGGGDAAERAPLGLAGVGFRAGARSVVASLWPAEDRSTAALMTAFYTNLREGMGRAEALREAQAALIADPATADPFQWANFILIGDWR